MVKSILIQTILSLCAVLATTVVAMSSAVDDLTPQAYIPIITKPDPQRIALMALYYATEGPNWTYRNGWGSSNPICEWERVYCFVDGRVRSLVLEANNLNGELPPELVYLQSLEALSLNNNNLSGTFTHISQLPNLEILRLHNNNFSGPIPYQLGSLSQLRELSLSFNNLIGSIPPQLGNLNNLDTLLLEDNNLSGSIPPELGSLSNLTSIRVGNNHLSGPIPPELGNLLRLSYLSMSVNDLSGTIPTELGNLDELYGLQLSYNNLSGPIPAALASMNSCHVLHLDNNPSLNCWETLSALRWAQNLPGYLGPVIVCP